MARKKKALEIKVKYHGSEKLQMTVIGDWCDLYTAEDVVIKHGNEAVLISLGVAMELPKGYEAIVAPRSSTYKNWKILQANGLGIIDEAYNGTTDIWKFPALNMSSVPVMVPKGTRLCQFRIQKKMDPIEFFEVDELGEDRGGFGTSGS